MPTAGAPDQQGADAEYNKRWLDIWDSGLEAGKVSAWCIHFVSQEQYRNIALHDGAALSPRSLCNTQRFDASKASPALLHLLDGGLDVRGKRALVPGCGVRPTGPLLCFLPAYYTSSH